MNKKDMKIFSPQWLEIHPYKNSVSSDLYYVQIANKVLPVIDNVMEEIDDENYLYISNSEKKTLACMLTAYFEDVISQTNIWNSFTKESFRKSGKYVPFFSNDEYAEEEINVSDIQFLCWHFMSQLTQGQIPISPMEPIFESIAKNVYSIFDEEYEDAPINEKLIEYFNISDNKKNVFDMMSIFYWLGTESYIFKYNSLELERELDEVMQIAKENGMEEHLPEMGNMVMTDFAFNNVTELYALTAPKWLGRILEGNSELSKDLLEMSDKISGYFAFESDNAEFTNFRHIATGKIINVTNRSMAGFPANLKDSNVIVFAGVVNWRGEWWFVGDLRGYDSSEELIEDISSRAEEINLFEKKSDAEYSTEEQDKLAEKFLADVREENPEDEELDINWDLLYAEGISTSYLKDSIIAGKYPYFAFPGENGTELMRDNIDFVLKYYRRN